MSPAPSLPPQLQAELEQAELDLALAQDADGKTDEAKAAVAPIQAQLEAANAEVATKEASALEAHQVANASASKVIADLQAYFGLTPKS